MAHSTPSNTFLEHFFCRCKTALLFKSQGSNAPLKEIYTRQIYQNDVLHKNFSQLCTLYIYTFACKVFKLMDCRPFKDRNTICTLKLEKEVHRMVSPNDGIVVDRVHFIVLLHFSVFYYLLIHIL